MIGGSGGNSPQHIACALPWTQKTTRCAPGDVTVPYEPVREPEVPEYSLKISFVFKN